MPDSTSLPPLSGPKRAMLPSIQAGRGVAALLVVLVHNSVSIFALPKYWDLKPFGPIFDFGHAGVNFFFVLSGFIILHVHQDDLGRPGNVASYVGKRLRRIYPFYWLVLAAILPAFFLWQTFGKGYERDLGVIASSFLLVHFSSTNTVLPAAWTLYHEMLFYAVFALMILTRRLGLAVFCVWMACCAYRLLSGGTAFPVEFYASPLNLLFAMGMACAWTIRKTRIRLPVFLAVAGAAFFTACGLEEVFVDALNQEWRDLLYGLGSASAILGLVELDRSGLVRVPGWFKLTGDASYAIYLVHFPLLSLLAKAFAVSGARERLPAGVSYVLMACLVVFAGIAAHLFIERPMLRALGAGRTRPAGAR